MYRQPDALLPQPLGTDLAPKAAPVPVQDKSAARRESLESADDKYRGLTMAIAYFTTKVGATWLYS